MSHSPLDKAKIKLVHDAYAVCDRQKVAANWIGISTRALRYWLNRYPELSKYKRGPEKDLLKELELEPWRISDDKYD